jgi:predicted aspartyl protease
VSTLIRAGTIKSADFTGTQKYQLADGSVVQSRTFRINSLKVGDIVIQNVDASVADVSGDLLLGQGFLARFKSWSVDNLTHSLILQ